MIVHLTEDCPVTRTSEVHFPTLFLMNVWFYIFLQQWLLYFVFQTKILYLSHSALFRVLRKCNKFKQIALLFRLVSLLITYEERASVAKLLLKTITVYSNCNAICVRSSSVPTRWLCCTVGLTIQLFDHWIRPANCWFLTLCGSLRNQSDLDIKRHSKTSGDINQRGKYYYHCVVSAIISTLSVQSQWNNKSFWSTLWTSTACKYVFRLPVLQACRRICRTARRYKGGILDWLGDC